MPTVGFIMLIVYIRSLVEMVLYVSFYDAGLAHTLVAKQYYLYLGLAWHGTNRIVHAHTLSDLFIKIYTVPYY